MLQNPKSIPYVIFFLAIAIVAILLLGCSSEPQAVRVVPSPTTTEVVPTITFPPTTEAPTTTTTTTTVYVPPTTVYVAPPTTTTVPVEVVPASDVEQMICDTFGDQCAKALSVVYCESRFNTGTVGAAGERGLFQIHPVHIPYLADRGMSWDAMFDPASNIAYAYDLYSRSGWGPWTCA